VVFNDRVRPAETKRAPLAAMSFRDVEKRAVSANVGR